MVRLRDSVYVDAGPDRVWAWLGDLPRHYREWHPAHIDCRYLRGSTLSVGTVLRVDEQLHGKRHSLVLHVDAAVPQRLLRYSGRAFRGAFMLEAVGDGTRLTAELEFGPTLPVVGPLLDAALGRLMAGRLAAIKTHMREEGQNLKRLLEARTSGGP